MGWGIAALQPSWMKCWPWWRIMSRVSSSTRYSLNRCQKISSSICPKKTFPTPARPQPRQMPSGMQNKRIRQPSAKSPSWGPAIRRIPISTSRRKPSQQGYMLGQWDQQHLTDDDGNKLDQPTANDNCGLGKTAPTLRDPSDDTLPATSILVPWQSRRTIRPPDRYRRETCMHYPSLFTHPGKKQLAQTEFNKKPLNGRNLYVYS
ncbi:uncharacterized protein [Narcine bancroftii]|uniref:uncharacterized protein isoform X3 n=1 Tax=Narcine bancroftii TaxID=1343680 RepID=UPI0038313337